MARCAPVPPAAAQAPRARELRAVVDETIALFHRLRWVAEQIYGDEGRSTARRGILRGSCGTARRRARTGAHALGHAAARPGGRHRAGRGPLVELIPNPRHRRSRLVRATARGQALVLRMDDTDDRVLIAVGTDLSTRELEIHRAHAGDSAQGFELGTRWRRVLATAQLR